MNFPGNLADRPVNSKGNPPEISDAPSAFRWEFPGEWRETPREIWTPPAGFGRLGTFFVLTLPPALRCASLGQFVSETQDEIRHIGRGRFASTKMGRSKAHLAERSTDWVGTTSAEFTTSLSAKQGPGNHVRASKEGCELATPTAGEGDGELIKTANRAQR